MSRLAAPLSLPEGWKAPDWPAPTGVRAVFTARAGGLSAPPFDSFNLGDHVRDEPGAVAANRARLSQLLGVQPVFLNQVHGTEVAVLASDTPDGMRADACIANQAGRACTIMVADCLPVLFAHSGALVVGAAHAGWRGLAGDGGSATATATATATGSGGVLESAFRSFADAVQAATGGSSLNAVAQQTLVWLGPCIGPQAFEVGAEVREAFVRVQADAGGCFAAQPPGANNASPKYLADLPALARLRLAGLGITQVFGNDSSEPWCTFSNASRFFSHRRDAARLGSTGRMAACIWLV